MKVFAIENHPNDSRVTIDQNCIVQTLSSRMGTGGGNVPLVMLTDNVTCYAVDSHPTDSRIRIVNDNTCPTLTAHLAKVSADGPLILIKENT